MRPTATATGRFFRTSLAAAAAFVAASLVNLQPAAAQTFNWDPTKSGSITGGGAGTWDNSSLFWYNGSADVAWPDTTGIDTAVFGGTAGTVTVTAGGVTANALTFNTTGYALTGGTLTLTGTTPTVNVASGLSATINDVIAGTGFTKTGTGGLSLGAAETLTGAVNLNGGITTLSSTATLSSSSGITLNNAALETDTPFASNLTMSGPTLFLNDGSGTTNHFGSASVTLNGGTIELFSSGSTTITNATVGTQGQFLSLPNGTGSAINITNLTVNATAMATFQSGSAAIGSSSTSGNVNITNLNGSAVASNTAAMLGPGLTVQTANASGGTGDGFTYFAAYGANGVTQLTGTNTTVGAGGNVVDAGETLAGSSFTVNSLVSKAANLVVPSSALLTINNGGLIFTGATHSIVTNATPNSQITAGSGSNYNLFVTVNTGGADGSNAADGNANTLDKLDRVNVVNNGANAVHFIKGGSGTLTLADGAAITATGGIVIDGGRLDPGSNTGFGGTSGSPNTGATVTINAGGTLQFNSNGVTLPNPITMNGGTIYELNTGNSALSGLITLNSGANTIETRFNTKTITVSGGLAGSAPLTLTNDPGNGGFLGGNIILTLTGATNTYSGTVTVKGQTAAQFPVLLETNTSLQFATLNMGAGGLLRLASPFTTGTVAGLTGTAGTIFNSDSTGRTLTVNNAVSDIFAGQLGSSTQIDTVGNISVANQNNFGLTMPGAGGTLILTGANAYSGLTTISAGTLQIGNGKSGTDNSTSGFTVGATGTLVFDQATATSVTQTIANAGTVYGAEGSGITINISGAINNNTTAGAFVQSGAGTTVLSNANGYTGMTTINNGGTVNLTAAGAINTGSAGVVVNGTLGLGISGGIGSGASVTVNTGGLFSLGAFSDTVASVHLLGGSITGTSGVLTDSATYDVQSGSSTAILAGSNGLTKSTAGLVTLSGASTYSGATQINAGTLRATNASGSATGTSSVQVNAGSSLGGTGGIGGLVTVAGGAAGSGGSINLVDGVATNNLKLAGGLTVGDASNPSNLNFEIQGNNADTVTITNAPFTVNAGGATINITNLGGVAAGETLTLASCPSGAGAGFATGSGGTTVGALTLSNGNLSFGVTGTLTQTATQLQLITSGSNPISAYWLGTTGGSGGTTASQWAGNNGTLGNFAANPDGTGQLQAYPAAGTDVYFAASVSGGPAGNLSNTSSASFDIKGLTFLATDAGSNTIGAVSIGGGNTLTIEGDGLTNANTNGVTLGMTTIVPNVSQAWTNSPGAGPLTVNAAVKGAATASNTTTVTLANNSAASTMTLNGAIGDGSAGGNLAVTINGTGAVVLAGANTFTGPTSATSGTLSLTGSLTGSNVSTSGTGVVSESSTGVIAGSGVTFTQGSSGVSILGGTNTFTGRGDRNGRHTGPQQSSGSPKQRADVERRHGDFRLQCERQRLHRRRIVGKRQSGLAEQCGSPAAIALTVGSSAASPSYSGALSGPGSVIILGIGNTQTLTGVSSYTGNTTITSGTLAIGGGGQLGSGAYAGNLAIADTFTYGSSASQTLSGIVSGAGTLNANGSGTLTLTSGSNSFSGPVNIGNNGTLTIGGAGVLASGGYSGSIADNGALIFNSSAGQTVSGAISGAGSLTQSGAGTLVLNHANTSFSGPTSLAGNGLAITSNANGSTASMTSSGGVLSLIGGNVAGLGSSPVTINGGVFEFGDGQTVSNNFILQGGAIFGRDNGNHLTGTLTINTGSVANYLGGTFDRKHTFIDGAVFGTGNVTLTQAYILSTGNQGDTVDFTNTTGNGTYSGTITIANDNVSTLAIDATTALQDSTINVGQARGNGNDNPSNATKPLIFGNDSFSITAATIGGLSSGGAAAGTATNVGLVNTSGTALTLTVGNNNNATLTFAGALTGGGSLIKVGLGTQILAGVNNFTGSTSVNGGTLQIGNGSTGSINNTSSVTVGASGNLAFDQGTGTSFTLPISNSGTVTGAETIGVTNTLAGSISGGGGFTQSGAGTTVLSVANSYIGPTSATNGTLSLTGSLTGSNVSTSGTGAVSESSTGVIAGSGVTFTQGSSGVSILGGANTYSGATTINAGTLRFSGVSTNVSTINVNNTGTLNVTGSIGAGPVNVNGGGTLSGNGAIAGAVIVAGGTTPSTQGNINLVTLAAGSILTLNGGLTVGGAGSNSSNLTFGASSATSDMLTINGAFTVNAGGATVTIGNLGFTSGENLTLATFTSGSYNGGPNFSGSTTGTTVDGLTLANASNLNFGLSGTLTVSATSLVLNITGATAPNTAYWIGTDGAAWNSTSGTNANFTTDPAGTTFANAFPGSTTDVVFAATGATSLTNTLGQSFIIKGLSFLAADAGLNTIGAVSISDASNSLTIEGDGIANANTNGVTLAPAALMPDVSQAWTNSPGAGPLTVNSAVTGTAIASNTTTVTLANNSASTMSLNGAIGDGSAGGNLAPSVNGTGRVVLGGANTFTGATTMTAGTLDVNNQLALQNSVLNYNGGAVTLDSAVTANAFTLGGLAGSVNLSLTNTATTAIALTVGNNNNTASYSGVLSGGGSLTKTGLGTQTLTGVNTYTGNTTVSNGTLRIDGTGSLNSGNYAGTLTLTSANSSFVYNSSANQTLSGLISGLGSFTQSGSGTTTLSNNANSFSGNITVSNGMLVAPNGNNGANSNLGVISSTRTFTINSGGTLVLNTNNTFGDNGGTDLPSIIVNGGGTLSSNQYNIVGNITINGGTLTSNIGDFAPYEGFQFNGSITVGGASAATIQSTGAAGATMFANTSFNVGVTGAAGVDLVVSSPLEHGPYSGGGFTKTGLGTMLLTGASTYTLATTVNQGTLRIGNGTSGTASVVIHSDGVLSRAARARRTFARISSAFAVQRKPLSVSL